MNCRRYTRQINVRFFVHERRCRLLPQQTFASEDFCLIRLQTFGLSRLLPQQSCASPSFSLQTCCLNMQMQNCFWPRTTCQNVFKQNKKIVQNVRTFCRLSSSPRRTKNTSSPCPKFSQRTRKSTCAMAPPIPPLPLSKVIWIN